MAELLKAVSGIFDGINQAVCSVFHLVGAFGRLNSAFVNGVIQAAKDCCFAVSMIGTSLWAALLEILCYIADFFLEVFHVLYGCLKVVSKIGLLIYMLCGAVLQILSIALQWLMKVFASLFRCCSDGLVLLCVLCGNMWQWFKSAFYDATASTAQTARSVGNQTLIASQKAVESAAEFVSEVGDGIIDHTLEFYGVISHFCDSCIQSLTTYFTDCWSSFVINLHEIQKLLTVNLTFPRNISQDFRESLQDYFPNVEMTLYDLLVILIIPSGTIFIIRFVVNYLNRKGMTFPLLERPRPVRIRPAYRHFVENSDEDLTEDNGETEDQEESENESEETEESDDLEQDPDAVFAAGEVDYEESDFEGDDYDAYNDYDDESVEEFEVATDTDESESEEDVQINVELPQTSGRYNFRDRPTSDTTDDPVFQQKLSPEELEKILENERDRRICVVCTDQPKTVVVLPCKHMCLCVDCAHEIVKQRPARRVCPLCRSRFNTVMHIYA